MFCLSITPLTSEGINILTSNSGGTYGLVDFVLYCGVPMYNATSRILKLYVIILAYKFCYNKDKSTHKTIKVVFRLSIYVYTITLLFNLHLHMDTNIPNYQESETWYLPIRVFKCTVKTCLLKRNFSASCLKSSSINL